MGTCKVLKDTSLDGEPGASMTSGAAPRPGGAGVVNQNGPPTNVSILQRLQIIVFYPELTKALIL